MRKYLSLFLLLMASVTVMAEPISRDAAQQLARDFLSQRSPQNARRNIRAARNTLALKPVSTESYYYVFNVGERDGFVVVSGNDCTEPILGYADSGSFDEQNLPSNMKAWLQDYADQLRWLEAHPQAQQAPCKVAVNNPILPLMNSVWKQTEPYNNSCPDFFSLGKCVTGCAATAMAQVMYYHQWPAATIKEIPTYQCGRSFNSTHIQVDAVPVNTAFDWNNMLPSYTSGSETDAQRAAVATLMAAVGAALNMDYANSQYGGSSASPTKTAPALKEYFDYAATTTYVVRGDYLLDDWMELLYSELAAARPVLYSGQSSGGGHGFVVDGYDGEGKFHINWGWGGMNDGYFLISVLNPHSTSGTGASTSKDGYSFNQDAVIGIKKNEGEAAPVTVPMTGDIVSVSGNEIKFSAWNNTGATNTFQIGLAIVNQDGSFTPFRIYNFGPLNYNQGTNGVSASVSNLPDGTFKIVPICRLSDTDTWYTYVNPAQKYVLAEINGESITLTLVTPVVNLTIPSFILPNNPKAGEELTIIANVKNRADEFYDKLYLFASTTNDKGSAVATTGCTVRAGETFPVEFFCTLTEPGTYNLWVATDDAGSNVIGQTTMTVAGTSGSVITDNIDLSYTAPNISPLTSDGSKILGTHVTVSYQFTNSTNNIYQGKIALVRYEWSGGSANGSGVLNTVTVPANSTKIITETYDLEVNKLYSFDIQIQKNGSMEQKTNYVYDKKTVVQAVDLYDADGVRLSIEPKSSIVVPSNTTAVDLRGTTAVTNISGGNPNTLYFLDAGTTAPSGASSNIVRNGVAQQLVITDGYDFATPFSFTATTATYNRTFATGYDRSGNGWNTITLPFDVQDVKVTWEGNDYPIDWFRSGDDTGKNFWIMQFAHEDDGVVYFSQAETFKAGIPYIIAVPGPEWGNGADLTGLPLHFSASNVSLSADFNAASMGAAFKMKGTIAQENVMGVYVLNNEGNHFTMNSAAVDAFRAYFAPTTNVSSHNAYRIATRNIPTAVRDLRADIKAKTQQSGIWYRFDGTRVVTPQRGGIYIHNGQKIIIK